MVVKTSSSVSKVSSEKDIPKFLSYDFFQSRGKAGSPKRKERKLSNSSMPTGVKRSLEFFHRSSRKPAIKSRLWFSEKSLSPITLHVKGREFYAATILNA